MGSPIRRRAVLRDAGTNSRIEKHILPTYPSESRPFGGGKQKTKHATFGTSVTLLWREVERLAAVPRALAPLATGATTGLARASRAPTMLQAVTPSPVVTAALNWPRMATKASSKRWLNAPEAAAVAAAGEGPVGADGMAAEVRREGEVRVATVATDEGGLVAWPPGAERVGRVCVRAL